MPTRQSVSFFVSLTIALLWTVECQTPITCTAGQYKPGEKATITCHFHGEVNTDQNTGVYITWFDLNAPKDSSGKEVLMCHFSGGAVSVCKPEDGYRFVSFKNNLTIEVPDVSAEFQGRYSCGVVPANGRIAYPCFLLVEGAFAQEQDAPKKPETHEELHEHVKTTHTLVIITFLIIIIIVAAAVIIFGTLAYNKKWFPFRKDAGKAKKDEENATMLDEGDSRLTGTANVRYNPSVQESTKEPLIDSRAVSSPQVEFQPPPSKEDTETRDSQSGGSTVMKVDQAEEKKTETKKEKQKREKREKAEKAAEKAAEKKNKEDEEKRQKQERKAEMESRVKNAATNEEKKRIKNDFDTEEKRLKKEKEDEEKTRKESEKGRK